MTSAVLPPESPTIVTPPNEPVIINFPSILIPEHGSWAERHKACAFATSEGKGQEAALERLFPLTLPGSLRNLKAVRFPEEMTTFTIETWGRQRGLVTAVIDDGFALMETIRQEPRFTNTVIPLLGSHSETGRYYQTISLQGSGKNWYLVPRLFGGAWPSTYWIIFHDPQSSAP